MSNPLDSLLPPDDGKKRPSSSSSYSRDPGGGRGGPRDVWGNPRDPKKEEVKEEASEYHRGGSSSTSTSRYRTGPGASTPSFSTPAQRAGGVQGYKREADPPKREYDQYGAPDSKRRHEGASTSSQYSPRDGPPDSFYAVSRIGVQLNSWGLDMSEMDECIKKVLFEVTLVAGERRHKLSDGIPMMKGDVNTQLKRLSSCVIFNKWCKMNPEVFRGKYDSSVAAYDAADTNPGTFVKPARIRNVMVINFDPRFDGRSVENFMKGLYDQCTRQGFQMRKRHDEWDVKTSHPDAFDDLRRYMERAKEKEMTIVIGIVEEKKPLMHDYMKYYEEKIGMQTLQITTDTARKFGQGGGGAQTINNVLRKLNPKCGGTNFYVQIAEKHRNGNACTDAGELHKKLYHRTQIRIFPERIEGNKPGEQNVPSGTCVDTVGNAHGFDEFVLCCQTPLIGTVRPTRYTILVNDSGWTKNEAMNVTYQLSFGHQVSYQPPAVPNVLYAAENLAKRGHNNFKTHNRLKGMGEYAEKISREFDEDVTQDMVAEILAERYIEMVSEEINAMTITNRNYWA
ncbi:hypothetical protein CAEBREN_07705 [Caenorhabditis brenneri]|uniref:Piwi domain-containing protein n=1 Tax=Caenorhabditis brenneri TaxID=135651 RepID=G0NFJ8_CAEBE|nr:hypothetical protein CAEBREN_07705 [Caenorhabditis brenneri]